jgi:hypothetical protein
MFPSNLQFRLVLLHLIIIIDLKNLLGSKYNIFGGHYLRTITFRLMLFASLFANFAKLAFFQPVC